MSKTALVLIILALGSAVAFQHLYIINEYEIRNAWLLKANDKLFAVCGAVVRPVKRK